MQDSNVDEVFLPKKIVQKKPISIPNLGSIPRMNDRPTHILDDNFDASVVCTTDTINNYMHPRATSTEDIYYYEQEMLANIYSIIHIMESTERTNVMYPMIVRTTFMQLKYLCKLIEFMRSNPTFLLFVKSLFHRYIAGLGHKELIDIYDEIFNDKLYFGENAKHVFVPMLSTEWRMEKIKEYQEQIQQVQIRKTIKRTPPKYEAGEIIGAKDKEGRWWMSKVLAVYEYQNNQVYYIEFIGWGEKFNEFIADEFRLQKFNPKKHRYFRPAWASKESNIKPFTEDTTELTESASDLANGDLTSQIIQPSAVASLQ